MNNRVKEYDIAKGIGMLLVILGHCGSMPEWLYYCISSFHMPLFFILGGVLYKIPTKTKEFVMTKAKRLLLPYFISMIIVSLPSLVKRGLIEGNPEIFISWISRILYASSHSNCNMFGIQGVSVFWFLVAFFNATVLLTVILKATKKTTIWILILGFAGTVIEKVIAFDLPFSLCASLVGTLYLYIGYVINKSIVRVKNFSIPILMLALTVWGLDLCFYSDNACIDLAVGRVDNILCFLGSVAATYVVVCISKILSKLKNRTELFDYIGKNSLLILCIHGFECFYNPLSYLRLDGLGVIGTTAGRIIIPVVGCILVSQISFGRKVYGILLN